LPAKIAGGLSINCLKKNQMKHQTKRLCALVLTTLFPVFYLHAQCTTCNEKRVATTIQPSSVINVPKGDAKKIRSELIALLTDQQSLFVQGFKQKDPGSTSNLLSWDNSSSNSIASVQNSSAVCPPVVHTNFEGNQLTPFYQPASGYFASECNIAISNAGKIVSISNSWINYYNENGSLLFSDSLYHFCSGLIDVRVTYDSKQDRFVFIAGYGITDFVTTFQGFGTVIAFSKTNDPVDGWNFYYIPYTDFSDHSSGDYPQLGISDDEAFVTLIYNGNNSIKHIEILQFDKNAGYAGAVSAKMKKYDAPLTNAVKGALVPAQGGSGTYGPGMYFLMANEESNSSDKYNVYEVNNTIASGQSVLNKFGPVTSNVSFSGAGISYQPGNLPLWEGQAPDDDVLQNAFYENGVLQFCQNTNVNGKAGIYVGRITGIPNNMSCYAKTVSLPNLYLSFPNIAYAGNSSTDNSAVVGVEHTGLATYPGLSAVYVNSDFEVSTLGSVKSGSDTINGLWGDYSGICRRYNHPGEVWFEGQYGSTSFKRINWISKLQKAAGCQEQSVVSRMVQAQALSAGLALYPNPVKDFSTIRLDIVRPGKVSLKILDETGRLVKIVANTKMEKGQHEFHWNTAGVSPGTYFLQLNEGSYTESKKLSILK
jgi:hypothetical protein